MKLSTFLISLTVFSILVFLIANTFKQAKGNDIRAQWVRDNCTATDHVAIVGDINYAVYDCGNLK